MVQPVVKNRISLLSRTKRSSVDHSLAMSSLVSSAPTTYFFISSRLLGGWDGLLVVVRRYYPASRFFSYPQIRISGCLPRRPHWCNPPGWKIWMDLALSGMPQCILGQGALWNPPSWARKFLIGHQNRFSRSVPW